MRAAASIATTVVLLAGCHGAGPPSGRTGALRVSVESGSSAAASATDAGTSAGGSTTTGATTATRLPAAPTKSADETIIGTPTSVTLEALLPYAPGKQRWTDQAFVVTGQRAKRLVSLLKGMQPYRGDAPAGCQPTGRSTTIRVESAGRQLAFRSFCDLIWAGNGSEILLSPALVGAVDSAVTTLRPTRAVVPPRTATLQVGPIQFFDKAAHTDDTVSGTVQVTQDGTVLGGKRLSSDRRLTLKVSPGTYTVAGTVTGLHCSSTVITVAAGETAGAGPYCSKR